jgi:hypothetical protein
VVGAGSYLCSQCGYPISLEADEELPECERCGAVEFRRASIFDPPTVTSPVVEAAAPDPGWLEMARSTTSGPTLAISNPGSTPRLFELPFGWTRIGRSRAADLRLDHPTVSRPHAQVVRAREEGLRVLEDRSLNRVFVNGRRIDWSALRDGDVLAIGRYALRVLLPSRGAGS